jgi:hypothetical protein
VKGVSPVNVDKPAKRLEPENTPLSSKERQGDKVPTEPVSSLSEQNSLELLFNSERISKKEPEEFKLLNGLLVCELCAKQGKPLFFASQHDLNVHVKSWHCGR